MGKKTKKNLKKINKPQKPISEQKRKKNYPKDILSFFLLKGIE